MNKIRISNASVLIKKALHSKPSFSVVRAGLIFSATSAVGISQQLYTECKPEMIQNEVQEPPVIVQQVAIKTAKTALERASEIIRLAKKMLEYLQRLCAYTILGVPIVCVGSTAYALGGVAPAIEDVVWDSIIWAIQTLGPTFVKLAQWASTRPDLYPPALIKRLESLQDDVKVNYSMRTVENTLREAFGDNWKDIIEIDGKPLGAGCVAQVFRGMLIDAKTQEKKPVAIKLIHPHVEKIIKTDMELLGLFATFVDSFPSLKILALGETCREYCNSMTAQLDLRLEASNLSLFASKFENDPWAAFPTPIEGFVRHNVLIETLMEGSSIVNFMKMKAEDVGDTVTMLKLKLSDLGCRSVIKMIFFDNLIHGDMHPGNILVQFSPKGEPRLVFLDAGIVYFSKTEADHKNLVEICFAFMKHDGYTAGKLMIDNSRNNNIAGAEAFCLGVQHIIDASEEHSYFEHIGEYVSQICTLARVHSVRLDPAYFQIAMALKVMEGVALSLNRDLELVSKCVPLIVKAKALRAIGITKFPSPEEL